LVVWLFYCPACCCSEQEQDKAQEQLRRERELRRKKEEEDSLTLEETKDQVRCDKLFLLVFCQSLSDLYQGCSLETLVLVSRHPEDMKNGLGLDLGLEIKVLVLILILKKKSWSWSWS